MTIVKNARVRIVVLLGTSGSGKSQFIDCLTGQEPKWATEDQTPGKRVRSTTISLNDGTNETILLVEVPAHEEQDIIFRRSMLVLQGWLKKRYGYESIDSVAAFLYLQKIDGDKSARPSAAALESCFGEDAYKRAILITTHWDLEKDTMETEPCRFVDAQLWKDKGATTRLFDNTAETAWRILEPFVGRPVSSEDTIIAVMGPTGTGKSHLIDTLAAEQASTRRSGTGLKSTTSAVQATRIRSHPQFQNRLVLVDTPGFDDTYRSDMDILKLISDWLKKTYRSNIKLSGIIYMHRITDNRFAGSPHRNLRMFGELCGDKAAEKVVFVTTMWDKVEHDKGESREAQLLNRYWADMLKHGATAERLDNSTDAAERIVNDLIARTALHAREALLLQEELVDLRKRLSETNAGIGLYNSLQSHLKKLETRRDSAPQDDEAELGQIRDDLERVIKQIKALKVSFGRRILLLFRRGPTAIPVRVSDPLDSLSQSSLGFGRAS